MDSPGGIRFARIDHLSALWMPPHAHEDAASLAFGLKGTVYEYRDRQTFLCEPSTLTLIPRGVSHANRFEAGASIFLVALPSLWIERVIPASGCLNSPRSFRTGLPVWIAVRMYREFKRRDNLTPLALEGLLLELLVEISRDGTPPADKGEPHWLRQATDLVHAHFTENLSPEAIAEAVGVHPAHLMRTFRQRHGSAIGEYVRRLRVQYACHLLASSGVSLAQVARETGFSDQSHFSHAFKRITGMTPTEFQRASAPAISVQKTHP